MSRAVAVPFLAGLLLVASSCYHAPEPEFLEELRRAEEAAPDVVAWMVEVNVESEEGSGEFQGQLVADLGDRAKVRLKLFHDLGSAALDIISTTERIDAEFPYREQSFHTELPPSEALEPSLLFLFGVTLWEHFSGLDPDRVVGVKDDDEGMLVKLEPHPTEVQCVARLDASGQVVEREFAYGWFLRWSLTVEEEGFRVQAPGVDLRLTIVERVAVDELPETAFQPDPVEE